MLPVLVSIGPFTLYSYGIFVFLAFFLALFVVWKRGREAHFDEEDILEMSLSVFLWSMVGSRALYITVHLSQFGLNIGDMLNIAGKPGFEAFGVVLAAIPTYLLKAKKLKWDAWLTADVLVVGWVLWGAISALGSFFSGSGAGFPTTGILGVYFNGMFEKRYPVQLLEFAFMSGLFWWLWRLESSYRTYAWYRGNKSEANSGFITAMALFFTGFIQLIIDSLRTPRLLFFDIRFELIIALSFISAGVIVLHHRSGWGIPGIFTFWFSEWGITGSLIERWNKKRKANELGKLKLGRDIFE